MPRSRKRSADATAVSASRRPGDYVAPGGGMPSDLARLSACLNLPVDAVCAVMNCGGQGVRSSRRSSGGDATATAGAAGPAVDAAMMNVWGDFMSEEMSAPAPAAAAASSSASASSTPAAAAPGKASPDKPAAAEPASGPRSYVLPIKPTMRLGKKGNGDDDGDFPTPGLLAQTGTLDASG